MEGQTLLSPPAPSVSLVEPGPVVTEFEGKLLAQVSSEEFPGTDPDTLHYFRDVYLPASSQLFRSVGQSPQAVVQVSRGGRAGAAEVGWAGPLGSHNSGLRPHRPLSKSSVRPDRPCGDRPTAATAH